jgi:hypothetical protein
MTTIPPRASTVPTLVCKSLKTLCLHCPLQGSPRFDAHLQTTDFVASATLHGSPLLYPHTPKPLGGTLRASAQGCSREGKSLRQPAEGKPFGARTLAPAKGAPLQGPRERFWFRWRFAQATDITGCNTILEGLPVP